FEPSANWTIYAIYAPQNRDRLEKAIGEELARALKDGFTDEEVRDGIAAMLNYRKLARALDDVLASTWIDYLKRGRTFEWSAEMVRQIAALTPERVNTALRKYLDPADCSTAVAGDFTPAKKAAP